MQTSAGQPPRLIASQAAIEATRRAFRLAADAHSKVGEAVEAATQAGQLLLDIKEELGSQRLDGGFEVWLEAHFEGQNLARQARKMMEIAKAEGARKAQLLMRSVLEQSQVDEPRDKRPLGITVGRPYLKSANNLCGYLRELQQTGAVDDRVRADLMELRRLLEELFGEGHPPCKESIGWGRRLG